MKSNCPQCGKMYPAPGGPCDDADCSGSPDFQSGEPLPVRSVRAALEMCIIELTTLAPRLSEPYYRSVKATIDEAKRALVASTDGAP